VAFVINMPWMVCLRTIGKAGCLGAGVQGCREDQAWTLRGGGLLAVLLGFLKIRWEEGEKTKKKKTGHKMEGSVGGGGLW